MGLTYCLLASGSKGNAVYVAAGPTAILVDCGLSARELLRRLDSCGLAAASLKAILITHEHRDHMAGVRVLAKNLRLPVLATRATWAACGDMQATRHQAFAAGEVFSLGGLQVQSFSTPHDAVDSVGLVISAGAARLGLCTDLGQALGLIERRLMGCQGLILESNHDPELLAQGPYPPWLKQRVRSRHGHLSNQQGAELLGKVHHPELSQVTMAHLSQTNNRPELAAQAAGQALAGLGSRASLTLARQDAPTAVMEL
ncbi:MAG: MBL fold metallo-hydrolase [Desulfarculus sp.]|nr:MBL fold metallo-hydrolase [Desulfarculus sp.]